MVEPFEINYRFDDSPSKVEGTDNHEILELPAGVAEKLLVMPGDKPLYEYVPVMRRDEIIFGAVSDCNLEGGKYSSNHDAIAIAAFDGGVVGVVADGVGRSEGSRSAADSFSSKAARLISELDFANPELPLDIKNVIVSLNQEIIDNPNLGTTVFSLGIVTGEMAYVMRTGDARVYLTRAAGETTQLTKDDSVLQEFADTLGISYEEAKMVSSDPAKLATTIVQMQTLYEDRGFTFDTELAYSRYFRCGPIIKSSIGRRPLQPNKLDLLEIPLEEGDKLLLCSDGLADLELVEMNSLMNTYGAEAAQALVDRAIETGASDNVSACVMVKGGTSKSEEYKEYSRYGTGPNTWESQWRDIPTDSIEVGEGGSLSMLSPVEALAYLNSKSQEVTTVTHTIRDFKGESTEAQSAVALRVVAPDTGNARVVLAHILNSGELEVLVENASGCLTPIQNLNESVGPSAASPEMKLRFGSSPEASVQIKSDSYLPLQGEINLTREKKGPIVLTISENIDSIHPARYQSIAFND